MKQETFDFIKTNFQPEEVDIFNGLVLVGTRSVDKDGYVLISHKGKTTREHQVIGYFIFGDRMIGKQINHIDGDKSNNKPNNLEICTASENVRHAFKTKLKTGKVGTNSQFTENDIINIRDMRRKQGLSLKEIADIYGVAFQTISRICNYDRWGHVPDDRDLADIDFDKYQLLAQRTVDTTKDDYDEVANYILGLICEASEIGDEIKKQLYHGHEIDAEKIKDELSDVLWYLANLARKYGLSLKEIAIHNILKLKERYPKGFSPEQSINREV